MPLREPRVPWRRLIRKVEPCAPHLIGLLALSLLAPPLAVMTPLPLAIAVDSVIGHKPLPPLIAGWLPEALRADGPLLLAFAAFLVVMLAFLTQLRSFASSMLGTYASQKLLVGFREELFRHLQRLSLAYHDARGITDSAYRIQYDATSIPSLAVEGAIPVVTSILTLLSMLFVTLRINSRLAIVAAGVCPLLFLLVRHYRGRLRRQARELRSLESSTLNVVNETLGAVRVVKAFRQEEHEESRFARRSLDSMNARVRMEISQGGFEMLLALLTASGTGLVLYIGAGEVARGALTLGQLLLVMGYLSQLYGPLKTMGKKLGNLQGHLAGAERAFALLDEAPDVEERPGARPLVRASGALELRHVSFGYRSGRAVIEDLSFSVRAGSCLGLVGATGAGKTTLVHLLARFYDPARGRILLDGVDLREYRLADLRDQFSFVLQEPVLFSASIGENIAYARHGAGRDPIVAAAKAANAHDFIASLPEGYDTPVGERGMALSGGERQRVSIARAFLKDAPILILDEPTSSVDAGTEAAIVEAMDRLMQDRTTIIISHRPAMLRSCSSVLHIDQGRLVRMESAPPADPVPIVEAAGSDPIPARPPAAAMQR